jgi:hypothetical protein
MFLPFFEDPAYLTLNGWFPPVTLVRFVHSLKSGSLTQPGI